MTPEYFDLMVDTYAVKTLPASVEVFGSPDANFSVESKKATPDTITIAGSSSRIAEANRAVISVNVAGKDKNFVEFDSVNVLDANGNTVTGLDVMPSQVKVNVHMKELTKLGNLPMKVETTGEPAKGYKVGKITINPPVATLTAPISYFEKNQALELPAIDVTGESDTVRKMVDVPVPEGGSTTTTKTMVTVEIEKE